MSDIIRLSTDTRRSRAVIFNGMIMVGGQTPDDRTQDIKGQTRQALVKIEDFLKQAGTHKGRLISVQIWVADIVRDITGLNEVWDAWTTPNQAPTRATAQVKFASSDLLLEITAIAAL